ncbi:DNA/RNA helicases, SNF2 family [hydrothermal vent metagenome]|uniref:DNA/RNA helicases, SNF2 family n=1 Tax=hydrothermal vent metagenome TaxID=652676 RepID=A0A3B0Y4U9_9ZZZZ
MPLSQLNTHQIQTLFSSDTYQQGEALQLSQQVSELESSGHISARVNDPWQGICQTFITVQKNSAKLDIDGECSCEQESNCAHVVATLLQLLKATDTKPANTVSANTGPVDTGSTSTATVTTTATRHEIATTTPQPSTGWQPRQRPEQRPDQRPDQSNKQLHYVLSVRAHLGREHLKLSLKLVSRNTPDKAALNHSATRSQSYSIPLSLNNPPRFIQPADLQIFQLLQAEAQLSGLSYFLPIENRKIIEPLLSTGRCHWQCAEAPTLTPQHTALTGRWNWQQHTDGSQQLVFTPDNAGIRILPCLPLSYLDEQTHATGLINSGLSDAQDSLFFNLPAYAADEIARVVQQPPLHEILTDSAIPLPQLAKNFISKQASVDIIFTLGLKPRNKTEPNKSRKNTFWAACSLLEGHLAFSYPGCCIGHSENSHFIGQFEGDTFIQWQRDRAGENAAIQNLQQRGWTPCLTTNGDTWLNAQQEDNGLSFARAQAFDLVQLKQQGWQLVLPDSLTDGHPDEQPGRQTNALAQVITSDIKNWQAELSPSKNSQQMLLSLTENLPENLLEKLTGKHNNQRINLIQALHISLHQQWIKYDELAENSQTSLLATDDQQILIIENQTLRALLNQLLELLSPRYLQEAAHNETRLILSRARVEAIQALCDSLGIHLVVDPQLIMSTPMLTPLAIPLAIPLATPLTNTSDVSISAGLNADLRDYQQQGVNWLTHLFQHKLGGLLADDMGLGKTLQILAFIWHCKQQQLLDRPVLILAPTSLLGNWKAEAEKFTPGLKLLLLQGAKRHPLFSQIPQSDLVITSYPLLVRDQELLLMHNWQLLILDEAQAIKNPQSRTSKAAREFNADSNFCLSGTPLENHLGELWSLFDFTLPGLLGNQQQFNDWFREPIEAHGDTLQYELLIERVRAFMLRRLKRDVLPQLPGKTHQLCLIEMAETQQQMYDSIHTQMKQNLQRHIRDRGLQGSRMHILEALTRLRQVCCDPRLLNGLLNEPLNENNDSGEQSSAKLSQLMRMLEEMLQQGRRVLIFSQFTSMLKLIEQALDNRAIKYALLTGQTKHRDREVKRFQQGEVPLFLISLKAGGSGLNLTRADTVIHYDPWWNPAAENQATDRAHRIGQHQSVMVYKLITENTIEQKILELQQRKQALADVLLDSSQGAPETFDEAFDAADLKNLLQLLDYAP